MSESMRFPYLMFRNGWVGHIHYTDEVYYYDREV